MDTQAVFGSVKASSAPSGKPEVMISFRGTEMSDVFTSFQKFQDLTSDLNVGALHACVCRRSHMNLHLSHLRGSLEPNPRSEYACSVACI